ncbi:MAG: hypothetical protein Udaeo2_09250 [Candidatus Udaeobacter sp.]|nr:MAG: hypothetical protein Udaeo2_09250 [Candidatus Udaeobacter sp.]
MGLRRRAACKPPAPGAKQACSPSSRSPCRRLEVRSAFFDLQQADRVLETETNNVQAADEALDIAKSNFALDWEPS